MSAKERKEGPPISMPDADPSGNYSFLEIVMGMHTTIGKLVEAVESLKTQSQRQGDKIDKIGKDVHAAKVVMSVVGGLIVLSAGFFGWLIHEVLLYLASHK